MKNILVVRRDNIGDLVCTTPLISMLRKQYPKATIRLLACSYNAPVLEQNDDLDEICTYVKAKHRGNRSLLSIYTERLKMLWRLRREPIDLAILATPALDKHGLALAKQSGARQIVGVDAANLKISSPIAPSTLDGLHQVEKSIRIAGLDIKHAPSLKLRCSETELIQAKNFLATYNVDSKTDKIAAFHISARKTCNQWSSQKFADLINQYQQKHKSPAAIFWSPGSKNDPKHPGDDEKLEELLALLDSNYPIIPYRTENLRELMAGLSMMQLVVCSDGGAMHVASGLQRPVIAFFGYPGAPDWRPWGEHQLIYREPLSDVSTDTVLDAISQYF
ncbi:glycosyltransferase family 9 protein [Aliamphritea ceti]|uniref:glycosyltransferase family 9 protein n=1 Tax=Aliamphritea ceti TaxID=1524258 RepID=UPI0021C3FD16|nr:glycosyltransferase family 9 protein [Aliamphritea ceti]